MFRFVRCAVAIAVFALMSVPLASADFDEEIIVTFYDESAGAIGSSSSYPVADITCRIRYTVRSGGGVIDYVGRNGCDTAMSRMTGRSWIEHPRGTEVDGGNFFTCYFCQIAGSSGLYSGAIGGYTYHFRYRTTITAQPNLSIVYAPPECERESAQQVKCYVERAFNANH